MKRRALVAAVAGWVTVVGATSAVAWVAIDRAGREVLTATSDARVVPGAVTTGAPHTPRPPRTQAAPTTTAASPTSRPSSTTSAPRATTSTRTHRTTTAPPAPTSSTTRPRTTTTTSTPARPAAVDRTVRVEGGQVGVRCVGQTASLRFAQPADGWAVRVEDNGPEHVKVTFRSSSDRREIEVESQCSDGTPAFSTSDDERRESDSHADD
ncbi:MAG: hypothetical protein ACTHLJ_09660 [Angustibacter sp.]